jgi:hypothetical protein
MSHSIHLRQHYRGLSLGSSIELNNRERVPNTGPEKISGTQQENSIKE